MDVTTNLGLKKPSPDDFINIQDLNDNADLLDEVIGDINTILDYINGEVI